MHIEQQPDQTHPEAPDQSPPSRVSRINLPNALGAIRLIGSFVLIFIALEDHSRVFVWVFLVLLFTDWIDGKLAVLLKQQTEFGARLDSTADAAMYAALLFGSYWMKWELIRQEAPWLIAVILSFAISCSAGLIKYGRIPSYHTRAAKICWLLAGLATVSVFLDWSIWPLRAASIAVTLTNLEALAITWLLPRWTVEVRSLYHAHRLAAGHEPASFDRRKEN